MADYQHDYVFCSPLDVKSLDEHLARPNSSVHRLVDTEDDPETALMRSQEREILESWVEDLAPKDQFLARSLANGESQATIARRQGVTEAAISKRLKALRNKGAIALQPLRRSVLLH